MENPSFYLEGVVHEKDELQNFEGPLSLILLLLQKNKIEIRDLSISLILDQYLEYLDRMQSMDLEIASEFVQMASHLLYIKTKTLLVTEEEVSELEVLMESLEQLKARDRLSALRGILPELKDASEQGLLLYEKRPEPLPRNGREYEYHHDPVELLRVLHAMFSRGVRAGEDEREDSLRSAIPRRPAYSVREKSRQLLQRLHRGNEALSRLYEECTSQSELVATFLSVLELCSMGSLKLERSGEDWMLRFVGGDLEEIMDKIEE